MSAPDSSNSKAPPSLLADPAKGPQANQAKGSPASGSRILADLEGRVAPPTDKPRRAKAPMVLVALLVVAAGSWGAWHLQQRGAGGRPVVAATQSLAATQMAAAPVSGSAAQAAAKVAAASASAASVPHAATIVADDSENKDSQPSFDAAASAANGLDDNRLSRALANGADMGAASAASAAPTVNAKSVKPPVTASAASHTHHEHEHETASAGAHAKHETPAAHHANQTAVAQAKKDKPHPASNGATSKDDPDADLLAALVARTKPADTKGATTKVSANTGDAKLAERVKECGTRGFFEDQLCRWRVCDGHWGKDPSCPGTAQKQPQP